jgi:predicted Zn-dependent protease
VHPALGVGFTVPNGFIIDNTSEAVLATGADGTALRLDAVAVADGTGLGEYLQSGWVNGLVDGSVTTTTVNGLPAASADADAKGWHFKITVIQAARGSAYRFIFANQTDTKEFEQAAVQTIASFRKLGADEIASLRPLRIRIVTVRPGDSEDTFVRQMTGVDRPRDLFRVLNELDPNQRLEPGTKLKIVSAR